jgi:2-oxoglutarate dehydrogenase E1 component
LQTLSSEQAKILAHDSPLSEYSVLGFEYGYSLVRPHVLTIWEAQFGDFANVGQAVIDQFIASAAEKWGQHARLVVLLPHGLEGQGPDHSSARIERILQLCARGNLTVAACSTPANFFHLLRAHAKAGTVPLIAVTPKSLLRHRSCVSDLTEFTDRHRFRPVLEDWHAARRPDAVRRVVLCSGKLFFELDARRAEQKADHVALLRVEQLYPYPADALAEALARYPNCDVVWCQEEPENMGPWTYLQPRLARTLDPLTRSHLKYVGRPESASPGSAAPAAYAREQTAILDEALA